MERRFSLKIRTFFEYLIARKRKVAAVILILASVLLTLPLISYAAGVYPLRLRVDGISIGLLDRKSAREKLNLEFSRKNQSEITLKVGRNTLNVKPQEAGVLIDSRRTIARLEGKYFSRLSPRTYLSWLESFYFPANFPPEVARDYGRLQKFKRYLDARFGTKPQDARVFIDESGEVRFVPERQGRLFEFNALTESLRNALVTGRPAELRKETALPKVTLEDVKQLAREQLPIFEQKSLVVFYGDLEYEVSGGRLKKLLESGVVEDRLTFVVRPAALEKELRSFFKSIEKKPKDASFDVRDGKVIIIPEKSGYRVDATRTANMASRQLMLSQKARVEAVLYEVKPEITAEKAKTFGIRELISSFTTEYNPAQTARVENIKLLARLLDGQLIAPGEVFSFNERIGPRTLERGFKPAPTIVNGRLVDTAGGGACQVGTTLFNAAFFAGLKIIERHNHSFFISHYPAGRDATVSYGGFDLKFKNDYKNWILIKAWAGQSRITISFYGTSEGRKVRFETKGPTDLKPFKREVVKDESLPEGTEKVEEKGVAGRRYVVTRYVYDVNGNLLYRDTFISNYRPKPEIVRVGTKVVETTSTTATTQVAN